SNWPTSPPIEPGRVPEPEVTPEVLELLIEPPPISPTSPPTMSLPVTGTLEWTLVIVALLWPASAPTMLSPVMPPPVRVRSLIAPVALPKRPTFALLGASIVRLAIVWFAPANVPLYPLVPLPPIGTNPAGPQTSLPVVFEMLDPVALASILRPSV